MSARDFLLNGVGPFMRKNGGWIVLILAAVGGTALLAHHVDHGPETPDPFQSQGPLNLAAEDAGG